MLTLAVSWSMLAIGGSRAPSAYVDSRFRAVLQQPQPMQSQSTLGERETAVSGGAAAGYPQ